jgi:hypothetical protein
MLLTHAEGWLDGTVRDRIEYLNQVMVNNATYYIREYLTNTVRQVWETHPAPRMHDEREQIRPEQSDI